MKMLHSCAVGFLGLLFWAQIATAHDADTPPIASAAPSASILSAEATSHGSVIKIAGQALFFEGLSEADARHVYNSIVYGGLFYGFASKMLEVASQRAMESEMRGAAFLLKLTELSAALVPSYYAIANIWQIIQAGDWYFFPHGWRFLGVTTFSEASTYKLAALFLGIGTVWDSLNQWWNDQNTQYIRVPLTGSASRKFFISALFSSKGVGKAVYTLTHTGQNEDNSGSDVFSHLSRVLSRHHVDFLVVSPFDELQHSGVRVTFHDAQERGDITIEIHQQRPRRSAPWLLHSLYDKQDRTVLRSARFALAPTMLANMADAIERYFDEGDDREQQGTFETVEINRYEYTPASLTESVVSEIKHDSGYSDFAMGASGAGSAGGLVARWTDGRLWPDLMLSPEQHDNDAGLTQWWIPEWIGHLLVAEVAGRGRKLAISGMKGTLDNYVVPHMLGGPLRRLQFAPFARRLPIRVDDNTRFEMELLPSVAGDDGEFGGCAVCQDNITEPGSYTVPCCRQVLLCEDCQQLWARRQYTGGNFRVSDGLMGLLFRDDHAEGDQSIHLRCMIPSCQRTTLTRIFNDNP